jgi:signal transduction histidine kinase/CheY-like chemotaxis protein/HAMP domain-containing protein
MVWNFILIFIVSTIAIVLSALRISKTISKPIVKMNRVAQQIGKGDYSVRNTIDSVDELGFLAQEFNGMAEMTESKMKIQQGIAEISETMIGNQNLHEFGVSLLKRLMKITKANMSVFYALKEEAPEYKHFASIGANKEMLFPISAANPQGEVGHALSTKEICHLQDISEDTIFKFRTIAGEAIPKEIITIPILVDNTVAAFISLVSIQTFRTTSTDILKQSWNSINTSYSNLLSSEKTRVYAEQLAFTNQQLESQTEELQEQSEELQNQTEELQQTSRELHAQNVELEEQRKYVEAANKMKSEFLSNMSHELRTPLNSIMALSRVMIMQANQKLNEEENGYLEIIERNGKRLLNLINDILDLSKIEAGKMEIVPALMSVESLLHLVKDNLFALADQKGLEINLSIVEKIPFIETDETKFYQVLTNIIGNAVKFTNIGSVDVSAGFDMQNVLIEVKDTGIGISEEMLTHVFDEFRQADGSASRQFEGTGLGLAIAKKLIQVLGGSINVKSKLGVGSVFSISVPIVWQGANRPVGLLDPETEFPKSETIMSPGKNVRPNDGISSKRLLIVEDKPEAIIQVKTVLENENIIVDVATSGQKALDYLMVNLPDGIILDLMMPEMDGFEVLDKIRNTDKTKNIPVLILTAKDLTYEEIRALKDNNIQQLIHKGNIDIEGFMHKLNLMLLNDKEMPQTILPVIPLSTKGVEARDHALPTIMVVENNADNLVTIKAILGNRYRIIDANDGNIGLNLALDSLPDLVLLDMALPYLSEKGIVDLIKKSRKTKDIPIIAVTAQAMKGDKERFIELGCDGYVSKPIDQGLLLSEIDRLLRK